MDVADLFKKVETNILTNKFGTLEPFPPLPTTLDTCRISNSPDSFTIRITRFDTFRNETSHFSHIVEFEVVHTPSGTTESFTSYVPNDSSSKTASTQTILQQAFDLVSSHVRRFCDSIPESVEDDILGKVFPLTDFMPE